MVINGKMLKLGDRLMIWQSRDFIFMSTQTRLI